MNAESKRQLALVTGASSGIGAALARLAAAKGFDVALVARRGDRLEALAREIAGKFNVASRFRSTDLCDPESPDAICNWLKSEGRTVDVLINNAGYSIPESFASTPLARQLEYVALSVASPVALTRHVLPGMIERGWGRIINISSITAFSSGGKGHTLYPASKSFIVKFSQSLSAEVAEKGVRVTAVCPGFVVTEFQQANHMAEKMASMPKFLMQTPEAVALEAWRRNDKGVEVVVPGLLPKFVAAAMKLIPEQITTPLMRRAAAKYYVGD
ncbi:MAG: SDR family NAD(P)-dependent oxidoreductase [Amphiplicatus sp.]